MTEPAVQFAPRRVTLQLGPGRLLSCAHTIGQVRRRKKTQTRRDGWWLDKRGIYLVRPGDRIQLVRKAMGRRQGEPLDVLAVVEVTEVRREPLHYITDAEVAAEGFPEWTRDQFVGFFCETFLGSPRDVIDRAADVCALPIAAHPVTVISWRYLDDEGVGR